MLIMDEAWNLFSGTKNSNITDRLLTIEGVPKFEFTCMANNQVFVFTKLVELVSAQKDPLSLDTEEINHLIKKATVTADRAAKEYKLLPYHYNLQDSNGVTFIVNKSLNARLPVRCKSDDELNEIMAKLLREEIIENEENIADFSINEQDYILLAPYEPLKLPTKPYINDTLDYDQEYYLHKEETSYIPTNII